jgi:hypothetical protein
MSMGTRWLAVVLLWKSFQHYGRAFNCANLEDYGINRQLKRRGLAELERADMVLMHRARNKSPRVKVALGVGRK